MNVKQKGQELNVVCACCTRNGVAMLSCSLPPLVELIVAKLLRPVVALLAREDGNMHSKVCTLRSINLIVLCIFAEQLLGFSFNEIPTP